MKHRKLTDAQADFWRQRFGIEGGILFDANGKLLDEIPADGGVYQQDQKHTADWQKTERDDIHL